MKALNLNNRTFLITFRFKMSDKQFLFQKGADLIHILKTYDTGGIDSIKILTEKNTFKRISKKEILRFFSRDAETYSYLSSHYYFI